VTKPADRLPDGYVAPGRVGAAGTWVGGMHGGAQPSR